MGKQKRMALLLHPFRRELYQVLCSNPGTYLLELVDILESPLGTLTWHLRILEREGLVKSIKYAGKRLYYPKMLRTQEVEMAYLTMRSDTAQKVFAFVVNNSGCYQEQMAENLNVHHDTVRWHVSRMEEVGLIKVIREDDFLSNSAVTILLNSSSTSCTLSLSISFKLLWLCLSTCQIF